MRRWVSIPVSLVLTLPFITPASAADETATAAPPLWVRHVENYQGGMSVGMRAAADAAVGKQLPTAPAPSSGDDVNVQMNDDTAPPMPQFEPAVAVNLHHPEIAIGVANDWGSYDVAVMRTMDAGATWTTTRLGAVFAPGSDPCVATEPVLAYSKRDRAFYLALSCFSVSLPFSEIQVFRSGDDGGTWTPALRATTPMSNYDPGTGLIDGTTAFDKPSITVDNTIASPYYGRIYITTTKFHFRDDGWSDYCPIELSYTDLVPAFDPSRTVWSHTPVTPDEGNDGVGESANQWSVPVVDEQGALTVSYVLEECNSYVDSGVRYQRSADGGGSFLPEPVRIDKPGQFVDNPDPNDILPVTSFRATNSVTHAVSPTTGTTIVVYRNYVDGARSETDISYQLSHDGGLTWGDTSALSTGPKGRPARNDQFFPWVVADETGVFYAIWLDRRRSDDNRRVNTWYAVSTDDGATWSSRRLSTRSWNPDVSYYSDGSFIGDNSGMATAGGWVYPTWVDGRHSAIRRTGIGEADIFTSVQRRPE